MLLLLRSLLDTGATPPGPEPAPSGPALAGGGGNVRRGGGPDAEVSLQDYLRRFGPKAAAPGRTRKQDDDEALALILCALAAESLTAPQF